MAGRGIADVVFVVDSSYSMSPCIGGVKNHIASFVNVFRDDANTQWDLRFEFLAHSTLFQNLLSGIAKSITKSQTPLAAPPPVVNRALFGQDGWQLVESKPRADQQ